MKEVSVSFPYTLEQYLAANISPQPVGLNLQNPSALAVAAKMLGTLPPANDHDIEGMLRVITKLQAKNHADFCKALAKELEAEPSRRLQ